jgi:hypothetical protein
LDARSATTEEIAAVVNPLTSQVLH